MGGCTSQVASQVYTVQVASSTAFREFIRSPAASNTCCNARTFVSPIRTVLILIKIEGRLRVERRDPISGHAHAAREDEARESPGRPETSPVVRVHLFDV